MQARLNLAKSNCFFSPIRYRETERAIEHVIIEGMILRPWLDIVTIAREYQKNLENKSGEYEKVC